MGVCIRKFMATKHIGISSHPWISVDFKCYVQIYAAQYNINVNFATKRTSCCTYWLSTIRISAFYRNYRPNGNMIMLWHAWTYAFSHCTQTSNIRFDAISQSLIPRKKRCEYWIYCIVTNATTCGRLNWNVDYILFNAKLKWLFILFDFQNSYTFCSHQTLLNAFHFTGKKTIKFKFSTCNWILEALHMKTTTQTFI